MKTRYRVKTTPIIGYRLEWWWQLQRCRFLIWCDDNRFRSDSYGFADSPEQARQLGCKAITRAEDFDARSTVIVTRSDCDTP